MSRLRAGDCVRASMACRARRGADLGRRPGTAPGCPMGAPQADYTLDVVTVAASGARGHL